MATIRTQQDAIIAAEQKKLQQIKNEGSVTKTTAPTNIHMQTQQDAVIQAEQKKLQQLATTGITPTATPSQAPTRMTQQDAVIAAEQKKLDNLRVQNLNVPMTQQEARIAAEQKRHDQITSGGVPTLIKTVNENSTQALLNATDAVTKILDVSKYLHIGTSFESLAGSISVSAFVNGVKNRKDIWKFIKNVWSNGESDDIANITREVEADSLDSLLNDNGINRRKYKIDFISSTQYADMQKNPDKYHSVLVESGNDKLTNKDGVYSIGADCLAGLPSNVEDVIVSDDGKFYYFVRQDNRDHLIKSIDAKRSVADAAIDERKAMYQRLLDGTNESLSRVEHNVDMYATMAKAALKNGDKVSSEEYKAAYQKALEKHKELSIAADSFKNLVNETEYNKAVTFNTYTDAINNVGWTQEQHTAYMTLLDKANDLSARIDAIKQSRVRTGLESLENEYHEVMSQINYLMPYYNRFKNSPVLLSEDYIAMLDSNKENMRKAVDQYNKWDSVTLHIEDGEALGQSIRTSIIKTLSGDETYKAQMREDRARIRNGEEPIYANDKAIKKAVTWLPNVINAATSDLTTAKSAYDSNNITLQEYTQEMRNIFTQTGSVVLSNTFTNLDVFDLFSIQQEYVAYHMATHPERYSNDPKYKQLQKAYEHVYGANYNGNMDAVKAAYVQMKIESGELGDYLYLDASDLRNKSGKKYNILQSMAVGILTDLTNVVKWSGKLATKAVDTSTTIAIKNVTTNALKNTLIEQGVSPDLAADFVKSNKVSKEIIERYTKNAVKNGLKESEDLINIMRNSQAQIFEAVATKYSDDILKDINASSRAELLETGKKLMAKYSMDADLAMAKGTVIASALYNTGELMDAFQSVLFKTVCPVACVPTVLHSGFTTISKFINDVNADKLMREGLDDITSAGKRALAVAVNLDIDTVIDSTRTAQTFELIQKEFTDAALNMSNKKVSDLANRLLSDYSINTMRTAADGYTSAVLNKYITELNNGGIDALNNIAKNTGVFNDFDSMYKVARQNLLDLSVYSTDVEAIINNFDALYTQARIDKTLEGCAQYIDAINNHEKVINTFTNELYKLSGDVSYTQGMSMSMADAIYNFTTSMNPDWSSVHVSGSAVSSIEQSALNAIDALDVLAYGSYNQSDISKAYRAVKEYQQALEIDYLANADAWYKQAVFEGKGVTGYLDNIKDYTVTFPSDVSEVSKKVANNIVTAARDAGYNISQSDVLTKVLREEKSITNLNAEQVRKLYRITMNKGTNVIAQVNNKNFIELTSAISDPNNMANRILKMTDNYISTLPETASNIRASRDIRKAISNAGAVNATAKFNNAISDLDGEVYNSLIDAYAGNSDRINSIAQTLSHDQAVDKITNLIISDAQQNVAKHHGNYQFCHNYGLNTIDVGANSVNISAFLDSEKFAKDEKYLDVCFSMNNTTAYSTPNDLAFFVRGVDEQPTIMRQTYLFEIKDDDLARKLYGKTAAEVTEDHRAFRQLYGSTGMSYDTHEEFNERVKEYIIALQQKALEENKTIRFIGFNSSDAVSGQHSYLYNLMRQCDVSVNLANTIDYADIIRRNSGEVLLDDDMIKKIRIGVGNALNQGRVNSITSGDAIHIAYDPKYTCTEILDNFLNTNSDVFVGAPALSEGFSYIKDMTDKVGKELGGRAYEKTGEALGMLIDTAELSKLLQDAGSAPEDTKLNIMAAVQDALSNNKDQLGLHKIIDTAYTANWFNPAKVNSTIHLGVTDVQFQDTLHSYAKQINNIYNSVSRIDLFTSDKVDDLKNIYKYLTAHATPKSRMFNAMECVDLDSIKSARELYALNVWAYDGILSSNPELADELFIGLLDSNRPLGSIILPEGRKLATYGTVDATEDVIKPFVTKYLDDSQEGYAFAKDLEYYNNTMKTFKNLKDYDDTMRALYNMNNVHSAADRLYTTQLAAVYTDVRAFEFEVHGAYTKAYKAKIKELAEKYGNSFDKATADKLATNAGVNAMKKYVDDFGIQARNNAVKAVTKLTPEEMKVHLIRNCGNGLVIDPNAACVKDVDLPKLFKEWGTADIKVEAFKYSNGTIDNRTLFRVYADLNGLADDAVFAKYHYANIEFDNVSTNKFSPKLRSSSFGASDMTLSMGTHMTTMREQFFDNAHMLDMEGRFNDWNNELYSCNMWTDSDLKQIVNPYYTNNALTSIAQSTHTVRNNISALHDLGTLVDNPYMNSAYIMRSVGIDLTDKPTAVQNIKKQLADQNYKLCTVAQDGSKLKVVDFSNTLNVDNMDTILKNTVCIDEGTYSLLNDWKAATNIAIARETQNEFVTAMSHAYKLYKDTIRSATVSVYLYGNIGTAVRNMVDSSGKAMNEVRQYDGSITKFLNNYKNSVKLADDYVDVYRVIKENYGTVTPETVKMFYTSDNISNKVLDLDTFNRVYNYDTTLAGSTLADDLLKWTREQSVAHFMDGTDISYQDADTIRKIIDNTYNQKFSVKHIKERRIASFAAMSNAERSKHLTEIHDTCMDAINKAIKDKRISIYTNVEDISKKFWTYNPTSKSWGERITELVPPMRNNQRLFNDAETRARLALYNTFMDMGTTDIEALSHVTATQFDYAGIGHVEDFLPFTQYKLYNAAYWFEHAGRDAIADTWRFAQYNGDGSMTNAQIAEACGKYQARQYYLYDKDSADKEYDNFAKTNVTAIQHLITDGVDSYLGLPREFQSGAIDLKNTHYLKLGNSFVEEADMIITLATGAMSIMHGVKNVNLDNDLGANTRMVYDALKNTPLYDSLYSPWKAWMDFAVHNYDIEHDPHMKKAACEHLNIEYKEDVKIEFGDLFHLYTADNTTRSEALAGIPVVGAIASNLISRYKNFQLNLSQLNLGELLTMLVSPQVQKEWYDGVYQGLCDVAGMIHPSVVGTKIERGKKEQYIPDYQWFLKIEDPSSYIDLSGRFQKMGYTEEEAAALVGILTDDHRGLYTRGIYVSKEQYLDIAKQLLGKGYTVDEIVNLFRQHKDTFTDETGKYIKLPDISSDVNFYNFYNALPSYIKYDDDLRAQLIEFYKAMGYSTAEAYAKIIAHPSTIINGKLVTLNGTEVKELNSKQYETYNAIKGNNYYFTDEEFNAYWDSMPFRYPKGKWKEMMNYLQACGYSYKEAMEMCLNGYMLDDKGKLVDVQGQIRSNIYSYNRMSDAEWNAYWETVPNATKYSKGSYGRTMKALKKMGYSDEESRAWIQQGIYVTKQGIMVNVKEYDDFNKYYQSLPDYIKYEKGAYKRTNDALKALGFDYYERMTLIKQGAYLMDASGVANAFTTLGARRGADGSVLPVTDINSLLAAYGGQMITGADGKLYMLVDASNLQRPRKTYNYSYNRRSYTPKSYNRKTYTPKRYVPLAPKVKKPIRHKFTFHVTSPYTTRGSNSSTYSKVNVLQGASYGYRQIYKVNISMNPVRQTMSTKSSYPAAYRNIVYAYRHNMYKDQYAKYGASRMQMRANASPMYSNASITRLRRNEIQNRLKYGNRRPVYASTTVKKKGIR